MSDPFAAAEPLLAEHAEIETQLADPGVHADAGRARKLGRRYAELGQVVAAYRAYRAATDDVADARELAGLDDAYAAELPALEETAADVRPGGALHGDGTPPPSVVTVGPDARLAVMFTSGTTSQPKGVVLTQANYRTVAEVMAAAANLGPDDRWLVVLPMFHANGQYYCFSPAIHVGASVALTDPAQGVWASLKYEGGVHRVQRVPVTESQGRIHTSAAGVLVLPEADDEAEVGIDPNDLRIDVFRSSGPGGQSVNTTDSAVRITYVPTGIVVSMQNEKSQLQNREQAMRVLRARLLAAKQEEAAAAASEARRSQVRTVDRSERIRTYNFPENRIADHRTGYKAYNLDQVMNGALQPVIDSCIQADEESRLAELADPAQ